MMQVMTFATPQSKRFIRASPAAHKASALGNPTSTTHADAAKFKRNFQQMPKIKNVLMLPSVRPDHVEGQAQNEASGSLCMQRAAALKYKNARFSVVNVIETRYSLPDCITACHSADKIPIHTT